MFKKLISSLLAASMLATFASAASGNTQTAKPSPHAIYVDGTKANVAAYEINGNNYFKLRDIAAIVNGSEKQFEVSWNNDAQRIDLTSGKAYTIVGGELGAIGSASKKAESSTAVVYKDNVKMGYTGYNIDDNNYYKLRDIGKAIGFDVDFDNASSTVLVKTTSDYSGDDEDANSGNSGNTGSNTTPTVTNPTNYTFNGSGWGHSVGMSQWGAYAMAQKGFTYDQILKFYFTGIEIAE